MLRNPHKTGFITLLIIVCTACAREVPSYLEYAEAGEELQGGAASVYDASPLAFSNRINGLNGTDELLFFVGNSFFRQNWVSAPSSTTARDGLGPLFNARSCSGCHFNDGRGRPPEFVGELSTGFLLRLGGPFTNALGEPQPDPNYGGQLQDQALPGIATEGGIGITTTSISGAFTDGETYELLRPNYHILNPQYGAAPSGSISPRVAPQMVGLGLLECLNEADVLRGEDPNDLNSDGISGRPNRVWDVASQSLRLGRFGWKANQPDLLQQTAGAFNGDMGITTYLFPVENCTSVQPDCQAAPNGGVPEIADDDLGKVVLYTRTLAVPVRRDHTSTRVLAGKELFFEMGCASCHTPKWVTGTHPQVAALSNQTIYPYTDLLLHDMGDDLADGRPDFLATGNEWRTPPLWGIGLFQTVNSHTRYLHDGRARNLSEAILWHGGEAALSAQKFRELSHTQRELLIEFLQSL